MSQNDMVIANANGSTVRSDINSALQALASCSSGSSAPSTTYACQLWFDTTSDLMKIRDEANANWVTVASLSGTTWTPYIAGTVAGNMGTLTYSAIAQALIMSGKQLETAKATVASATTPNLSTAGANAIELTGTTTITGFTTGQAGTLYYVEYTGAGLTLTHNATSLICPTAANIPVSTGDSWFIFARGSNNVRIFGYQKADGTSLGGSSATQAEMEAASSTTKTVTPGRVKYHPGVAKAWINFNGSGTPTARDSYNVSSITDNGVGDYTINFSTAFSGATYDFNVSVGSGTSNNLQHAFQGGAAPTASAFRFRTYDSSLSGFTDATWISATFFGDQA